MLTSKRSATSTVIISSTSSKSWTVVLHYTIWNIVKVLTSKRSATSTISSTSSKSWTAVLFYTITWTHRQIALWG